MAKKKQMGKFIGIIAGVLAGIIALGTIIGLTRNDEKTLNRWFDFEVAAVEADGDLDKDAETNIVSDLVDVKGLKVEIDDNEDLTFKVHYYDEDGEYISSTAALTEYDAQAEDTVLPEGAEKARVEFTHAKDDEISFDERIEYLGDVKVTLTEVEDKKAA